MEEHLHYQKEAHGLILSFPDIHMEWRWLVFGDIGSFGHHKWDYGDNFLPAPKYEMVMVNEHHHTYESIVMAIKGPSQ